MWQNATVGEPRRQHPVTIPHRFALAALFATFGCSDDVGGSASGDGTGDGLPTGSTTIDAGTTTTAGSNSADGDTSAGAGSAETAASPDATGSGAGDTEDTTSTASTGSTGRDAGSSTSASSSGGDEASSGTTASGTSDAGTSDAGTTGASTTDAGEVSGASTSGETGSGATSNTSDTDGSISTGVATVGTTDAGATTGGGGTTGAVTGGTTDTGTTTGGGGGLDLGGPPQCTTPGEWIVELIDNADANDIDIAVGASGTPQVVWVRDFGGGYAHRDSSGQWQVDETIGIGGDAVGLAVNPTGAGDATELPFAANFTNNAVAGVWSRRRNADGTWTGAQLDTTNSLLSGSIDLAYAPDGTLHGAYSIFTGQLVHATADPSEAPSLTNWDDEVVDATIFFTSDVSIDVADTTIHIAYAGGGDLRYARREDDGAFMLNTVDAERPCTAPAIAIDSLGNPAISYHDDDLGDLRFAYEDGGWSHEFVDGAIGVLGRSSGLGVTDSGQVVIAHWDFTGLDVESAVRDDPSVGAWDIETVDFADIVGAWTSAQMDGAGGLHVAYLKAAPAPDEIRYAYRCPG